MYVVASFGQAAFCGLFEGITASARGVEATQSWLSSQSLSPYTGRPVPDTPPTTYNAASPDGSPVSITLPGQSAIGRQPGYYNVGLDTVGPLW